MAGITNSSIQPWLDFHVDESFNFSIETIPATIPSCQTHSLTEELISINCTTVCNNTNALIAMPKNLLTCGFWTTLVTLDSYNEEYNLASYSDGTKALDSKYQDALGGFTTFGLDVGDGAYVSAAIGAVSEALTELLENSRFQTYQGVSIQGLCSQQTLFPATAFGFNTDIPQRVRDCVNAICAPRSLNPDIGGVGVFTSLLMQLGIAITIFLGLLWLTVRPLQSKAKNEDHMANLATALLDFHRAQCYFIAAIEIAELVLIRQMSSDSQTGDYPVYDLLLSVPLSLNGIVPVVFSLSCIALYSRLSWHIILLSIVPIALSTGVLASTRSILQIPMELFHDTGLSTQICGSKSGNLENVVNLYDIRIQIVWLIYTYCIVWILWCIVMHILKNCAEELQSAKVLSVILKNCAEELLSTKVLSVLKSFCLRRLRFISTNKLTAYGYYVSLLVWGLCFAYHFFLYGLFVKSNLVSGQWSLGQIIAVTVWVPSLVELFYIEHEGIENGLRYRYPPGIQVVKRRHEILERADTIPLIPQSVREAESNENEAA